MKTAISRDHFVYVNDACRGAVGEVSYARHPAHQAAVEVYATEYGRTGFTGALQGYRVRRLNRFHARLRIT
jgi:hypothetical protein